MLKILKNFFENQNKLHSDNPNYNLQLLCGLMIEAANTDGTVDINETDKIKNSLLTFFEEDSQMIDKCLDEAIVNRDNSKSLHYYTSRINKEYDYEKKMLLIEILWDIVLSDGNLHDYEASLIRRLSGLLYINDIDSGNIKKKCLTKISNKLWHTLLMKNA